jgi:predicted transcriptional regulator
MNFSNTLEKCRKHKQMSKKDLAIKIGKSAPYITLLEQGKREPNLSLIEDIFMFLASHNQDIAISDELADKIEKLMYQLIDESDT